MRFKKSLENAEDMMKGGAGVFSQEDIAFIENEFEDMFRNLHVMKDKLEEESNKYEQTDAAKEMSYKDAPWHMPSCGHNFHYKVTTLKEHEERAGLMQYNQTIRTGAPSPSPSDKCGHHKK